MRLGEMARQIIASGERAVANVALVDLLAVLMHDFLVTIQRVTTAALERAKRTLERRFTAVNVDMLS